ncbi:MAG: sulfatase [Planctomycetes bacterium]|nr:sulfatase [Planctomycetota bacterium]MCH9726670.1 sulfatase [Planctomycetota bacterium]MCH9779578.1 sulfatase [Planctomycetota bacterium]MCH9789847.1 sulfatase [Planctomycetota bacterium]
MLIPRFHIQMLVYISLLFCSGNPVSSEESQIKQPPNVVFIAIDDLRTELGCYGVHSVQSPSLDKLASEGVLFTNHFVQVPTCGASRYALLTGRSPKHSGVTRSNQAFYRGKSALSTKQTPGAQTLPELFRRNGYHTMCIGKISHTADGRVFEYNGSGDGRVELPHAWNELATPFGSWKRGWGIFFAYANGRSREDGSGIRDLMEFTAEKDEDLPDGILAQQAIKKLKELKVRQQPFFMGLGFFKPHLPFVAPRQDWEAMSQANIVLPPHPEKIDSSYWHKSGEFYSYNMEYEKTRPLSPDAQLKTRRAYLACVRYVDRQVGKVLAALDELGLYENTIVVVWGDHGWFLGDTALWAKHAPFERALKSTLIIRAPGVSQAGLKSSALVESIDLYPTLIDLCHPKFSKTEFPLDGLSLKPILTGKKTSVRDVSRSYWRSAVSVRTNTHRLIATYNSGKPKKVELYDISKIPDPVQNLATRKPEIVQEMLKHISAEK